jgi:hypothetical protein
MMDSLSRPAHGSRYSALARASAMLILLKPRRWIHRVVESFEVDNFTVRQQVSLHMTLPFGRGTPELQGSERPGAEAQDLVVPILTVQRGKLIDNLDVFDASDRSLPVLSHGEHQEFSQRILEVLAIAESGRSETTALKDLSRDAVEAVVALTSIPILEPSRAQHVCDDFFSERVNESDDLCRLRASRQLHKLASLLVRHYFVLVEVRAAVGSRCLIKYGYDATFRSEKVHLPDILRTLGGHTPQNFIFETTHLRTCESYHFRMRPPEGFLVYRQRFVVPDQSRERRTVSGKVTPLREADFGAGLYMKDERASPYAHMYVGGGTETELSETEILAEVRLFAWPPKGSVAAVALAVSTIAVLLTFRDISGSVLTSANDAIAFAALLLALPGTLAATLGIHLGRSELLAAPLAARATVFAVKLASLVAALMFLQAGYGSRPLSDLEAWYGRMSVALAVLVVWLGARLLKNAWDARGVG